MKRDAAVDLLLGLPPVKPPRVKSQHGERVANAQERIASSLELIAKDIAALRKLAERERR